MEMHLVHKANDGTVGVLAVLFEIGERNESLDPLLMNLPGPDRPQRESDNVSINVSDLLPKDYAFYFYHGSFTTPPCTEYVQWVVLRKPVSVLREQLKQIREVIKCNNRPVQRLHGCEVFASE